MPCPHEGLGAGALQRCPPSGVGCTRMRRLSNRLREVRAHTNRKSEHPVVKGVGVGILRRARFIRLPNCLQKERRIGNSEGGAEYLAECKGLWSKASGSGFCSTACVSHLQQHRKHCIGHCVRCAPSLPSASTLGDDPTPANIQCTLQPPLPPQNSHHPETFLTCSNTATTTSATAPYNTSLIKPAFPTMHLSPLSHLQQHRNHRICHRVHRAPSLPLDQHVGRRPHTRRGAVLNSHNTSHTNCRVLRVQV